MVWERIEQKQREQEEAARKKKQEDLNREEERVRQGQERQAQAIREEEARRQHAQKLINESGIISEMETIKYRVNAPRSDIFVQGTNVTLAWGRYDVKDGKISDSAFTRVQDYSCISATFNLGDESLTINYKTIGSESWRGNRRAIIDALADAYLNPRRVNTIERKGSASSGSDYGSRECGPCLPKNALISTPMGLRRVENLRIGDPVWTVNKIGERVASSIVKDARVATTGNHRMLNIVLDDGRELFVSPGHPKIDGKPLTDLIKGECFDGAIVISVDTIPYKEKYTYDVLPAGDTGGYWANNILLGSTLFNNFENYTNSSLHVFSSL